MDALEAPVSPGVPTDEWSASALFRDETGRYEIQVTLNGAGRATATLMGADFEGFGDGAATVLSTGRSSVRCSATVDLAGYEVESDRLRYVEAAVGATWAVDRLDPRLVEVAGTVLVTDLGNHGVTCYRAVRHHPVNHLDLAALPNILTSVPVKAITSRPSPFGPALLTLRNQSHRAWSRGLRRRPDMFNSGVVKPSKHPIAPLSSPSPVENR